RCDLCDAGEADEPAVEIADGVDVRAVGVRGGPCLDDVGPGEGRLLLGESFAAEQTGGNLSLVRVRERLPRAPVGPVGAAPFGGPVLGGPRGPVPPELAEVGVLLSVARLERRHLARVKAVRAGLVEVRLNLAAPLRELVEDAPRNAADLCH